MLSLIKKQPNLIILGLFFLSVTAFTWGLKSSEVVGFDSRFYLFALEMWEKGINFFPTTYNQPYADYSAASTLLIYVVARTMGGLNKFTATLPTAVVSSLTLIFTYLIGQLYSKRWGLYAVAILLMTVAFVRDARSISLDMYVTLFTTICFYLLIAHDKAKKPLRLKWIFICLTLGFIFRGPIGLVIPTSVVIAYYFVQGNYQRIMTIGMSALFLLLICSILLLLLAYAEGGSNFSQDVFRMQGFGRISNIYQPPYFYFVNSFSNYALAYPIVCLVAIELLRQYIQKREHPFDQQILLKLLAWAAIIIIGMSIPGDKKPRYILPMVPALALLCSYVLLANRDEKLLYLLRTLLFKLLVFFPLFCILLTVYAAIYIEAHKLALQIYFVYPMLLLFLLSLCNLYFYSRYSIVIGIATLAFLITFIAIVEPILVCVDKAQKFVVNIESHRLQEQKALVFYDERPDGLAIKYLINMPRRENPIFLNTPAELLRFKQPAYFVTNQRAFNELPKQVKVQFNVVTNDKLGHVDVVVFEMKGKLKGKLK